MSSTKAIGADPDPNASVSVPLEPQKKARLIALAQQKGLSPEDLVIQAIDKVLAEIPAPSAKQPTRSLRGLLAKYGRAPSAEIIDQNRAEMFANFPRSEFE